MLDQEACHVRERRSASATDTTACDMTSRTVIIPIHPFIRIVPDTACAATGSKGPSSRDARDRPNAEIVVRAPPIGSNGTRHDAQRPMHRDDARGSLIGPGSPGCASVAGRRDGGEHESQAGRDHGRGGPRLP